jgi:hypothetical protein
VARVHPRPPTDDRSRLEVAAAALADQAADVEIVVRDARDASAPRAPGGALEALLVEARAEATAAREELAVRVAGEAELVAAAGRLRLELDDARARLAARDERDARVAGLVAEVADAAREARMEVERHAGARERAEAQLADARERLGALEAELEAQRARAVTAEHTLRTELGAVHRARDWVLAAEGTATAAREAELSALKAAHARLRPAAGDDPADGDLAGAGPGAPRPVEPAAEQLADGLARAARRLREQAEPPQPPPASAWTASPPPPTSAGTTPRLANRRRGLLARLLRARR